MPDLFYKEESRKVILPVAPLAERIRPKTLEEFVGQDHLTQFGRPLRLMLEQGEISSMIFWDRRESARRHLRGLLPITSKLNFINLMQFLRVSRMSVK